MADLQAHTLARPCTPLHTPSTALHRPPPPSTALHRTQELAEHALTREFSHLLLQHPDEPRSRSYVRMFKEVCERQALLMAEWLRVGYCQARPVYRNSHHHARR